MSLTLGWRRATSSRPAAWAAVQPIMPLEVRSSSGISGTPWSARILRANSLCCGGHQAADLGLELVGVHLVHALVLGRDHDVDAVGLVAHVLVDPGELHLELLGGEGDGAEDADAAGVGDGGDDVAAVGEGEDGELDAEPVADLGVHGGSPVGGSVVGSVGDVGRESVGRRSAPEARSERRRRRRRPAGRPTRAASPRRARSSGTVAGVEALLHGQSGQQGLDQDGRAPRARPPGVAPTAAVQPSSWRAL